MTDNKPDNVGQTNGDQQTGEKHQIEHEAPDAKRPKTDDGQTTLDDMVIRLDKDEKKGESKEEPKEPKEEHKEEANDAEKQEDDTSKSTNKQDSTGKDAVQPSEEPDVPSSILEKGIIYFFIRGRVNLEDPESVDDIARSFIMLRPIAKDARLGDGVIADAGNTRILALPKKTLPESGKEKYMVFVEKSGASFDEIKNEFLAADEYDTKSAGTRRTPPAKPVGEGVYAITSTGRESHLAYLTTLPEKLDEVQKELGLKEKGSFIISTKNPQFPGPQNAQLPEGPGFSKEIIDEFRSLRWLPSKPAHFDYVNAQILLIGESEGIEKAVEPQKKDQKDGKEEPETVLEHLEDDDVKRMKHLADDQSAAIYADLHVHAKDYPKLQTTF
ncbi:hypothetical protein FVEN_g1257 [Fusarium venenatum]|uniref:Uncharacterized protein n=1 Tax=Fusarium venenatum TaxID=56646 RepID=A0A2L2TWB0_9HYPO|nr:uncharacterized protein FVRRES_10294 [Fusarium venenatum]KAG8361744.1 hypothetical protein FVEN_g1257 [Fusarium venenatum]CEI70217.1 unnamed protein product [Fusarium venenatum]